MVGGMFWLQSSEAVDLREALLQARIVGVGWITGSILAVPPRSRGIGARRRVGYGVARRQVLAPPPPDFGMAISKIHQPGIAVTVRRDLIICVPPWRVPTGEFVIINAVAGYIHKDRSLDWPR